MPLRTSRRIPPPGAPHRIPRCSPISAAGAVTDVRVPGLGDAPPNRVRCGVKAAWSRAVGRGDRVVGALAMRPARPRKMFSMRSACSISRANDRGSSSPPSPNCRTGATNAREIDDARVTPWAMGWRGQGKPSGWVATSGVKRKIDNEHVSAIRI
jgi:hypothetical protein